MRLRVRVIPGSSAQRLDALEYGSLRAKLNSHPIGGRANEELRRLLSKRLRIPRSVVSISAGSTGRNKLVDINVDLAWDSIVERLSGRYKGRDN